MIGVIILHFGPHPLIKKNKGKNGALRYCVQVVLSLASLVPRSLVASNLSSRVLLTILLSDFYFHFYLFGKKSLN